MLGGGGPCYSLEKGLNVVQHGLTARPLAHSVPVEGVTLTGVVGGGIRCGTVRNIQTQIHEHGE